MNLQKNVAQILADEFKIELNQVDAVIKLLDEGATVPFIARYRKEATGGVDDTQLRDLVERLEYLRELEDRRATILKSIEEQGKLSEELRNEILAADNKTSLEDLYLPYKPKRRTKAQIAKEAGLEPLALALWQNPQLNPELEAETYVDESKGIADTSAALEGAKHILMEMFAEQAELVGQLRHYLWENGILNSKVVKDKESEGIKFSDYFDFSEPLKKIPSHRALALFRGSKQDFLRLSLDFPDTSYSDHCHDLIARQFNVPRSAAWLWQVVENTWKIKLHIKLELELLGSLREQADEEAIHVFKENLKNLLMTAPAGNRVVMGLDPGLRTGVKVVVVDGTGKLLEYTSIFPHVPRNQWDESLATLAKLCKKHQVELISIGNGTASRETDRLAIELIKLCPETGGNAKLNKIVVSEAGASVYSASASAAAEFPDLDVSYRGAVSIARRLQDPLAELVKIDPKSIGVGQYQHDVNQVKLGHSLAYVLEDCVNAVGADVNTASVPLLTSVSGLNEGIAKNIVMFREQHGRFRNREAIKKVPRLGEKTYEQAIGFLRIVGGDNPLDASAVHPESYPVVDQIMKTVGKPIESIMGNVTVLNTLQAEQFVSEKFGLPTVHDIFQELTKPGRDPRPEFKAVEFREGVETMEHLKPGMILDGVVTNVANFGAFVDIGVHQDGLVHISEVAEHYVKDIREVVKVGQIVKVKVVEVDVARKRIGLSMKLGSSSAPAQRYVGEQTQSAAKKSSHQPPTKAKSEKAKPGEGLSQLASQLQKAFNK